MNSRHRNSFLAFSIGLLFATVQTHAIPQDRGSTGTDTTLTPAPPTAETDIDKVFERTATPAPSLILQHDHPANPPPLWTDEPERTFKVIGRYSERFNNMDVDEMVADAATNEAMRREHAEHIPLDPEAIQSDLGPATNDTQLAQLLYQVRKSFAKQRSAASEIQGLRLALTYLAMAAVITVVIFARR
jgi:hypothetical protein